MTRQRPIFARLAALRRSRGVLRRLSRVKETPAVPPILRGFLVLGGASLALVLLASIAFLTRHDTTQPEPQASEFPSEPLIAA